MNVKRWGVAVAAAGLMLVAAVWVVPGWLDWNRYRDSIAALLSDGLGRPVRIDGAITLTLLPQPVLTASGLSVDAGDAAGEPVFRARAARLRVALGPLLAGQVVAQELVLQGADLTLPWPMRPGALAERPPAWLAGLQARVEDSAIRVGTIQVSHIDARVETDADTGTLTAAGAGLLEWGETALPWRFSIRLARPGRDGSAPLEASVDGEERLRDTGAAFSGQLGGDGTLTGRVNGRGPNLSLLLPAPALAWRADGLLRAGGGLIVADELAAELGGAPARGSVAVRLGAQARVDVTIAAGRLDLDAWSPILARPPMPGLPAGLDVSAESVTFAGGVIRQLRGAFEFTAGQLTVRDLSARLPGDAALGVKGTMPRGGAFEGTAQLDAPDLGATLRWAGRLLPAGMELPTLPTGVLQAASLAGTMRVEPGLLGFTSLTGTLDGATVKGSAHIALAKPRPALTLALSFGRLTLDPWLALGPSGAGADADVQVDATEAQWRGLPVTGFAADAQWSAGRLTLRRFEGTMAGLRAQASGVLTAAGTEPARLLEGRAELRSDDVSPAAPAFLRLAQPYLSGWNPPGALLSGPLAVTLAASGPAGAVQVKVSATVGDLRIEAQPVLDAAGGWAGPVTLRHPGAPRLLRAVGLPGIAGWIGDGSLSVIAQMGAGPGWTRVMAGPVDVSAGLLRGRAQLGWEDETLRGAVQLETLPLPDAAAFDGWPVRALQGWQAELQLSATVILMDQVPALHGLVAELRLQDAVLSLQGGSGMWRGGVVKASGAVDAKSTPARLSGRAEISGVALEATAAALGLESGMLSGSLNAEASGQSLAALLATVSGTAQLRVQDGVARGFDLAATGVALGQLALASVRDAMLAGATPFDQLSAQIDLRGGLATLSGTVAAPAGAARFAGTIDLPAGLIDARISLEPAEPAGAPALDVRVLGPVASPRRTPDLTALSRWLAARP